MSDLQIAFTKMTPGAMKLARTLGVAMVKDLASLNLQDIEALRDCVSAAKNLVDRYPSAGDSVLLEQQNRVDENDDENF